MVQIFCLNFEIENKNIGVGLKHEAIGHLNPPLCISAFIQMINDIGFAFSGTRIEFRR